MEKVEKLTSFAQGVVSRMSDLTLAKSKKLGLANTRENKRFISKTICDLNASAFPATRALVIASGPSLHRRNSVDRIVRARDHFDGTIVVADGSLGNVLRKGLIPDFVVSVDGHSSRIVRWFGDPDLANRPQDEYFSRQLYDPVLWENELKANEQMIRLVNEHGPKIKAIVATSVHPSVAQRCIDSGMDVYWWNPIVDDIENPDGITAQLFRENGVPCMNSGGNVGSSAWVFSHAILEKRHVGIVGMDFGYAPGTDYQKTQYYPELKALLGDRIAEAFISIPNPYENETWFCDPTYYWYRESFLEMSLHADCETYNCTEGGTVFGNGIHYTKLDSFLT